jgi:hypothetical protein
MASAGGAEALTLEESDGEVSVSPNPFTTGIKISIPDPKVIKSIVMIDLTGKQVEIIEHENIRTEQTIGTRLMPGLYVLEVNGFHSRKTFKLIKQ